jgi:hypothetical protein
MTPMSLFLNLAPSQTLIIFRQFEKTENITSYMNPKIHTTAKFTKFCHVTNSSNAGRS